MSTSVCPVVDSTQLNDDDVFFSEGVETSSSTRMCTVISPQFKTQNHPRSQLWRSAGKPIYRQHGGNDTVPILRWRGGVMRPAACRLVICDFLTDQQLWVCRFNTCRTVPQSLSPLWVGGGIFWPAFIFFCLTANKINYWWIFVNFGKGALGWLWIRELELVELWKWSGIYRSVGRGYFVIFIADP